MKRVPLPNRSTVIPFTGGSDPSPEQHNASNLPAPLVPLGVDLRDFPFTPMFRTRLFGSDFHANVSDPGWRAGVTLWLRSWDQAPAGTLPDDELTLCRLAELGRDLKTWRKLEKEALWGWFKCSDGRLHHRTVAEGVMEAWKRKLAQRGRTEAARAAKAEKRKSQTESAAPTEPVTNSVTETVTGSKGQGQGQGESKRKEPPAKPPSETPAAAEPAKGGRAGLSDRFLKELRQAAGRHCRRDQDTAPIEALLSDGCTETDVLAGLRDAEKKAGETFVRWSGLSEWIRTARDNRKAVPGADGGTSPEGPRIMLKPGVEIPASEVRRTFLEDRWPKSWWGPPIGQPGCGVPVHLAETWLAEKGAARG